MDFMKVLPPKEWKEEDYSLSEFTQKFKLPQVVKFTQGQYLSIGVPSCLNKPLSQTALLSQVDKRDKVLAQCVTFRNRKSAVPIGYFLSIPDTFDGLFEILSENGRAVKCIENVSDLLIRPCNRFLVRENIKAHLAKKENQTLISKNTRTVCEGEMLVIEGELFVPPGKSKYDGNYLKCLTTKGETLFLNVYQKGKFSPTGVEGKISGVHNIKQLISCKRFPLLVRLVYGKPPDGLKIGSEFTMEMRLHSLYKEESIMALPLLNFSELVALPPSKELKVQVLSDPEKEKKSQIFDILVDESNTLYQESCDKIQIFQGSLTEKKCKGIFEVTKGVKIWPWDNEITTGVSDPRSMYGHHTVNAVKKVANNGTGNKSNTREHIYDEIDEIYTYVRRKRYSSQNQVKPNHSSTASSSPLNTTSPHKMQSPDKPEPSLIDTKSVRRFVKEEDNQILPPGKE